MSTERPILCDWNGEAFIPASHAQSRVADQDYVVGERYRIAPLQERSQRSHAHYFACINESWRNLPDKLAERFSTPEHLRKFALIKAGFRDERSVTCASKAEALRVAAFVRDVDNYAIVVVHEATVIHYTAKSQSLRAMGKKDFQDSKDKVLQIISDMIGVQPATLQANAERAA